MEIKVSIRKDIWIKIFTAPLFRGKNWKPPECVAIGE